MSPAGQPASAIGRVAAAVRRHFADPTFYARRYRASVGARDALAPRRRPFTFGQILRAWTWWLPRSRRGGAPPDAIERWIIRPAVFIPAVPIGLALVVATLDVRLDAPPYRQLPGAAGVFAAWLGLTGAMGYIGRRWPRAEPVLVVVTILLGVATLLCGTFVAGRATAGYLLRYLSGMTLGSLAVAWWKGRSGNGEG